MPGALNAWPLKAWAEKAWPENAWALNAWPLKAWAEKAWPANTSAENACAEKAWPLYASGENAWPENAWPENACAENAWRGEVRAQLRHVGRRRQCRVGLGDIREQGDVVVVREVRSGRRELRARRDRGTCTSATGRADRWCSPGRPGARRCRCSADVKGVRPGVVVRREGDARSRMRTSEWLASLAVAVTKPLVGRLCRSIANWAAPRRVEVRRGPCR